MEIKIEELLGDTLKQEVAEIVADRLYSGLKVELEFAIQKRVDEALGDTLKTRMNELVNLAIDDTFTDVDSYGRAGKTASIRERVADYVQKQCAIKDGYNETTYSRILKETVSAEVRKFKEGFDSRVNKELIKQSAEYAMKKLKEAMGIKP
jgi:hypothetical protein